MLEDVARTVHIARQLGEPHPDRAGRRRRALRPLPERLRTDQRRTSSDTDADREIWFLTGSQGLYGDETLEPGRRAVAAGRPTRWTRHDGIAARGRRGSRCSPTPTRSAGSMLEANADDRVRRRDRVDAHVLARRRCGSAALDALRKPLLHLHTQANVELPWATIDMDFMNLNQAAHGDREFGYIQTRLRHAAQDRRRPRVATRSCSQRVADVGRAPPRPRPRCARMRLARFGDNMRDVAVTEGDKVEAELRFGVSVNTYGVNDLVAGRRRGRRRRRRRAGRPSTRTPTTSRPSCAAAASGTSRCATAPASRLGLRAFLEDGGFTRLHHQLRGPRRPAPAARPRRAAADGRRLRLRRRGRLEDLGAAAHAEGRWRRACPAARPSWRTTPTTSTPGEEQILGAHMLEVCPTIAAAQPALEIHPLGIGGREDPVRLVFDADPGPGRRRSAWPTWATGSGWSPTRSTWSTPPQPLPKLPVARAVWQPQPDFAHLDRGAG